MLRLFVLVLSSSTFLVQGASYALNLGNWSTPVTTNSTDAQQWFDTAWMQMWGFNHEEAIRCYEKALTYDPSLMMAHVGLALSYGPNYNNLAGLSASMAYNQSQQALMLINMTDNSELNYTDDEIAIAFAVSSRSKRNVSGAYWDPRAYTNSLRDVYTMYPNNTASLRVSALFAEALLLSSTGPLWVKDSQGNLVPGSNETVEVINVLENGFKIQTDYPPFCHLYVHVMEQSDNPEKALIHADHLRSTVPDQGHLRHMPSHVDVWVGHYGDAVDANKIAIQMDNKYIAMNNNHTLEYYKNYVLHNHHFLIWACMFTGESATALQYSRSLQSLISNPLESFIVLGGSVITAADFDTMGFGPWQVMFRFAKWDLILAEPIPSNQQVFPARIATAYLTRAIAYAATGRVNNAQAEQTKFEQAVQNTALKGKEIQSNLMWNPNTTIGGAMGMNSKGPESGVLNVGYYVLKGLIEHAKHNVSASVTCLQHAVEIEQSLRYAEPWGWMLPARHTLGQVLLANSMFAQAEQVFRDDLAMYPSNLWALNGLTQSLTGQKKSTEAASIMSNYTQAASRADVDVAAVMSLMQNQTVMSSAPCDVVPSLSIFTALMLYLLY